MPLLGHTGSYNFINNYFFNEISRSATFEYTNGTRIPYVGFSQAETAIFIAALDSAILTATSSRAAQPQIRLFIAATTGSNSQIFYFTPILQIHKESPEKGFRFIEGDLLSIPASFQGYYMGQNPAYSLNPSTGQPVMNPSPPPGTTELTAAQESQFATNFKTLSPGNTAGLFITTSGALVQQYTFTEADSKDIRDTAKSLGNCILRCVMGANPPTESHPVDFRPMLELLPAGSGMTADVVDTSRGTGTYWDFSNPCPPNCGSGN